MNVSIVNAFGIEDHSLARQSAHGNAMGVDLQSRFDRDPWNISVVLQCSETDPLETFFSVGCLDRDENLFI